MFASIVREFRKAIELSEGKITEDVEDAGYALEFLAWNYPEDKKNQGIDLVYKELGKYISSNEGGAWFSIPVQGGVWFSIPILCSLFILSGVDSYMNKPFANISHMNSSLRDYVLNCVFLAAPMIQFSPELINPIYYNIKHGQFGIRKCMYLIWLSKGDRSEKNKLVEDWLMLEDEFGWVKKEIEDYNTFGYVNHPFDIIEYNTTKYLGHYFQLFQDFDDDYLIY